MYFKETDPFLTIPRKVMMTTGTAKESLLGESVIKKTGENSK